MDRKGSVLTTREAAGVGMRHIYHELETQLTTLRSRDIDIFLAHLNTSPSEFQFYSTNYHDIASIE